MTKVRIRGLWTLIAGAVILAPPWYYLWLVDYRGAPFAGWAGPLTVAFITPALYLCVEGIFAILTGKRLPRTSVRLRL